MISNAGQMGDQMNVADHQFIITGGTGRLTVCFKTKRVWQTKTSLKVVLCWQNMWENDHGKASLHSQAAASKHFCLQKGPRYSQLHFWSKDRRLQACHYYLSGLRKSFWVGQSIGHAKFFWLGRVLKANSYLGQETNREQASIKRQGVTSDFKLLKMALPRTEF